MKLKANLHSPCVCFFHGHCLAGGILQIVVSPNIDSYIWDTIARTLQLLACGKQLQYFSVIFLQFSHHILQTHNSYTDPPHTRYRIHGYDLSYLQHSTSSAPSKQRYWEIRFLRMKKQGFRKQRRGREIII